MGDRIKVIGPVRDWVEDIEDPDDGTTLPGYWQKMFFVEAEGTDGVVHAMSYAFGDSVSEEHFQAFVDGGKKFLQQKMEADGVW